MSTDDELDELIGEAREVLDGRSPSVAALRTTRGRLVGACEALERSGDRERLADALEQLVEANRLLGDVAVAIDRQRQLVALRGELHGVESAEVGDELRWLGTLWFDQIDTDSGADLLAPRTPIDRNAARAADEAFAGAYRRFLAEGGEGDLDALEMLVSRVEVAVMAGDRSVAMTRVRELLDAVPDDPRKRDRKRLAKLLREGAAACESIGIVGPADVLGRRAAALVGEPFTSIAKPPRKR